MNKVADFYRKAMSDEEVKAKLDKVLDGEGINSLSDDKLKEIGGIAKGLGFDITLDEAKDYLASVEGELTDEALQEVAGGGNIQNNHCKGSNSYVVHKK